MAVNRYAAACSRCGNRVPAQGGMLERTEDGYAVRHTVCSFAPSVVAFRFGSGATVMQNARGRCEDAPCCGCCS